MTFNMLLGAAEIQPADVCLLRHQKSRQTQGRPTPYAIWRRDRAELELYQSHQNPRNRTIFSSPYWASFIATPGGETLFGGLYSVSLVGSAPHDLIDLISGRRPAEDAIPADFYSCTRVAVFEPYVGLLKIAWGLGALAWKQYARTNDKPIVELAQSFVEPAFPGYLEFIEPLDALEDLPPSWIDALRVARGVYVLTCPRTSEFYVGSASSEDGGFFGRWRDYIRDGHGGNVHLKSRDPSNYQVSILEVVGSRADREEIVRLEEHWKRKLQSRLIGLN